MHDQGIDRPPVLFQSARRVPAPLVGAPLNPLSAALRLAYILTSGAFWVCGSVAFATQFSGLARLLGLAYLPILALPLCGKGTLAGFAVKSFMWWVWFAFDVLLASLLIVLNRRPGGASQSR